MSQLPGPNASGDAIRHQLAQPLGGDDDLKLSATVMTLEAENLRLRERVGALEALARSALEKIGNGAADGAADELRRMVSDAEASP